MMCAMVIDNLKMWCIQIILFLKFNLRGRSRYCVNQHSKSIKSNFFWPIFVVLLQHDLNMFKMTILTGHIFINSPWIRSGISDCEIFFARYFIDR